jgi:magnesium-transporting ATPase (P-type)
MVIVIIFLIISMYLMESEKPYLSIPFIMIGLIFSVIVTFGLWNVEVAYTAVNVTTGGTDFLIYNTEEYGDPYSYIFFLLFFIYIAFFVRAGFNWLKIIMNEDEEGQKEHINY